MQINEAGAQLINHAAYGREELIATAVRNILEGNQLAAEEGDSEAGWPLSPFYFSSPGFASPAHSHSALDKTESASVVASDLMAGPKLSEEKALDIDELEMGRVETRQSGNHEVALPIDMDDEIYFDLDGIMADSVSMGSWMQDADENAREAGGEDPSG